MFKDILGFGETKPFDCVGTFEESQSAINLAAKKFKKDYIVKKLGKRAKFHKEVFRAQKESAVPEQFKFLGMENVLILGYGREGEATEKYLKKYHPELSIGIADLKTDKNYLKRQDNFDIAVKTPGINRNLLRVPYVTATNIFFSRLRQPASVPRAGGGYGGQAKILGKNTIIGVTGSKGKSTTASLIYKIIKTAGKNVEFLGNIGKPMIEAFLRPIPKNKIFVLELSSYQLDDIKFSPDIAVTTNLFPEHMDFHKGEEKYYNAKKNIINFQGQNGYFIYNPKNKIMKQWLYNYAGHPVPFAPKIPVRNTEIPILGEHNKDNIRAAVSVAKILRIPDKIIKKAIMDFKGLPHRLEFIGEFKGIKFYDDAISTTPESTIMAIKTLKSIGSIFLGGEDRGYKFGELEKALKKHKIKNVVLFPESGKRILKNKRGFNVIETKSMEEAVRFAYKNTQKNHICLLSCASPSYSLWKNFEEKGDEFKKYVIKFSR